MNKIKIIKIFLAILFFQWVYAAQGIEGELKKLNDLIQNNKLEEATASSKELEKLYPGHPNLLFLIGIIETRKENYDQALLIFNDLTVKYPNYPEPYNNMAVIYAERNQLDEAIKILERAINTNKSYATAYINLGDIYSKKAAAAYGQVLKIDEKNKIAQNKLQLIDEFFNYKPVILENKIKVAADNQSNQNDEKNLVLNRVDLWRKAWEMQDMDNYFASYANNYKPSEDISHEQWRKLRNSRIKNKNTIRVTLDQISATKKNDQYYVSFIQHYSSGKFKDSSSKLIILQNIDQQWKIVEELSN